MALKTYKTAKGILQASIRDIEAGHWCKGALAKLPPGVQNEIRDFEHEGKDHLLEDFDYGDHMLTKDPLGCAVGLVALHGGEAREIEASNGKKYKLYEVEQPTEVSTEPVKEAITALANVIPKRTKAGRYVRDAGRWGSGFGDLVQAVVTRNDSPTMKQEKALQWFKDALASLSAGNKAGGSDKVTP